MLSWIAIAISSYNMFHFPYPSHIPYLSLFINAPSANEHCHAILSILLLYTISILFRILSWCMMVRPWKIMWKRRALSYVYSAAPSCSVCKSPYQFLFSHNFPGPDDGPFASFHRIHPLSFLRNAHRLARSRQRRARRCAAAAHLHTLSRKRERRGTILFSCSVESSLKEMDLNPLVIIELLIIHYEHFIIHYSFHKRNSILA